MAVTLLKNNLKLLNIVTVPRDDEELDHGHNKRSNQTFLCRINVSRNARRQMR